MPTERARVAEVIASYTADGWRVYPHTVKRIPELAAPAVFIDYISVEPLAEAGIGHLTHGFELSILSHLKEYANAEDQLDDDVREFVRRLDAATDIAWSRADKRSIGDYLGWVVVVQLISSPETGE